MTAAPSGEAVVDYAGFDFARLWPGRETVIAVERSIVARALAEADPRRFLELGVGFGRLLQVGLGRCPEVVAVDYDLATLERLSEQRRASGLSFVGANAYHLPFVDGAFTAASVVRLYHHLLDPARALAEIARVLRPGARLLVSYNPSPSVGTLVQDVRRALRPPPGDRPGWATISKGPITFETGGLAVRVGDRSEFADLISLAGFRPVWEIGTGFEELAGLRRARPDAVVRIGAALARAPAFPSRFACVEKVGGSDGPLPLASEVFACPRCGRPRPGWGTGQSPRCEDCAFEGRRAEGVIDLRYVPLAVPARPNDRSPPRDAGRRSAAGGSR